MLDFCGGTVQFLPALVTARYDRYTVALVRHNYKDEGDCIFETLHGSGARMHSTSHYTLWRIESEPDRLVVEQWPELPSEARESLTTQLRLQLRDWGVDRVS